MGAWESETVASRCLQAGWSQGKDREASRG
jgi:hypothetical protein